jgi:hypothetical protein
MDVLGLIVMVVLYFDRQQLPAMVHPAQSNEDYGPFPYPKYPSDRSRYHGSSSIVL